MKKEDKKKLIDSLAEKLENSSVFYIADVADFSAEDTTKLRRACYKSDIRLQVVKNTLLRKAMEKVGKGYDELYDILKGPTSIMFAEKGNAPAKVIKDFRKDFDKPILKGAYIEEAIFIGDDKLEALSNIKSKEELVADVIALLQSPAKNVISALKSSGGKLAGIMKTLSEKEG